MGTPLRTCSRCPAGRDDPGIFFNVPGIATACTTSGRVVTLLSVPHLMRSLVGSIATYRAAPRWSLQLDVTADDLLAELRDDNKQFTKYLRESQALCDEYDDVATASLIENWIDEAERRTWFLFGATRRS